MNPDQAPWPLNRLQEAQRNRERLASRFDQEDPKNTVPPENISIDSQNTRSVFSSKNNALETNGKFSNQLLSDDISDGNESVLSDNNADQTVAPTSSAHPHDLNPLKASGTSISIHNPELESNQHEENSTSRVTKFFLAISGIAALVLAGIFAYENPMTTKGLQSESLNTEKTRDLTGSTPAQTVSSETNTPPTTASPSGAESEDDSATSSSEDKTVPYSKNTTTIDDSIRLTPEQVSSSQLKQAETSGPSHEFVTATDSLGDLNQDNQLTQAEYQSISEPQLETNTDVIVLVNKSDYTTTDTSGSQVVEKLLLQAQSMFNKLQLTIPPGQNAFENYRKILEMNPDNAEALHGIESIKLRLLALSERAITEQKYDRAKQHIAKVIEIDPENVRARQLIDLVETR